MKTIAWEVCNIAAPYEDVEINVRGMNSKEVRALIGHGRKGGVFSKRNPQLNA